MLNIVEKCCGPVWGRPIIQQCEVGHTINLPVLDPIKIHIICENQEFLQTF